MNATDNHRKRILNIFSAFYSPCQPVCMVNTALPDETKIKNKFTLLHVPGLEDSMQNFLHLKPLKFFGVRVLVTLALL